MDPQPPMASPKVAVEIVGTDENVVPGWACALVAGARAKCTDSACFEQFEEPREARRHVQRNPGHIVAGDVMFVRVAAQAKPGQTVEPRALGVHPPPLNMLAFLRAAQTPETNATGDPQPPEGVDMDSPVGLGGNPPWTWRDLQRVPCPNKRCRGPPLQARRFRLNLACPACGWGMDESSWKGTALERGIGPAEARARRERALVGQGPAPARWRRNADGKEVCVTCSARRLAFRRDCPRCAAKAESPGEPTRDPGALNMSAPPTG